MMALFGFIALFTFSHGGNWSQQGDVFLSCGMCPLWPFVNVAEQNFEENLPTLITPFSGFSVGFCINEDKLELGK